MLTIKSPACNRLHLGLAQAGLYFLPMRPVPEQFPTFRPRVIGFRGTGAFVRVDLVEKSPVDLFQRSSG